VKWLLLGAVLGLLLAFPTLWTTTVAAVAWLAAKPVVMAFVIGLVVRPHLPVMRRWAR
jgi:hypothetical protein